MSNTTNRFPVKRLPDGRAFLNLACGTRMHNAWNNVDFSPYARLKHRPALTWLMQKAKILSAERSARLAEIDPDIVAWDLRKGIPFAPGTFDVVYHSHFLEHIDREFVPGVLKACHDALKPGGVLRVVVPDLELLTRAYLDAVADLRAQPSRSMEAHEFAVSELFDQMVRTTPAGTAQQRPLARTLERLIRGNAADTGELHRWMYDEFSLNRLLLDAGFRTTARHSATSSGVAGWPSFNLDTNADGSVYKPESIFVEATK